MISRYDLDVPSYDYSDALELAGAVVHDYERFGSYHGDWWARVTYEGRTGFVHGDYGSCPGCDTLESIASDMPYKYETQELAAAALAKYKEAVAEVGRGDLMEMFDKAGAIAKASEHLEWDLDAKEMVDWLTAQPEPNNYDADRAWALSLLSPEAQALLAEPYKSAARNAKIAAALGRVKEFSVVCGFNDLPESMRPFERAHRACVVAYLDGRKNEFFGETLADALIALAEACDAA